MYEIPELPHIGAKPCTRLFQGQRYPDHRGIESRTSINISLLPPVALHCHCNSSCRLDLPPSFQSFLSFRLPRCNYDLPPSFPPLSFRPYPLSFRPQGEISEISRAGNRRRTITRSSPDTPCVKKSGWWLRRSLPAVEMTKMKMVEMAKDSKVEMIKRRRGGVTKRGWSRRR
jgi:hypothetical protein